MKDLPLTLEFIKIGIPKLKFNPHDFPLNSIGREKI